MNRLKNNTIVILLALCGSILLSPQLATASPSAFDVAQPLVGQPLGTHLATFSDPSGAMDVHAAIRADGEGRFTPAFRNYPNFSPSTDTVWLRLDVVNSSATRVEWILEMSHPFADWVDLYVPDGNGAIKTYLTGDRRPVDSRIERRRTFVFPLGVDAAGTQRYYLRTQSSGAVIAALNAWSRTTLDERGRFEEFGNGIFFGIVLGLFAYNLFLWFSFRDRPTQWYLLYMGPMTLAYVSFFGYTAVYLWGEYPWFAGGRDIHFFYFVSSALYFQFARAFLDTPTTAPKMDRVMLYLIYGSAASAVLTLMVSTHISHLVMSLNELTLILLPFVAAVIWRRGYRPARFYLLATLVFVITIVLLGLWNFGFIDTSLRFFYLTMSIGTAVELILFSMALADRINILRAEKEHAQKFAEHTLRRAADDLERQVEARTAELQRAMARSEQLARTDDLTGVMNRRAFFEAGERELKRVHRYGRPCAIAVFDLDHFKAINDTFGHAIGDAALIAAVDLTKEALRDVDSFGRIGGEEFAILLPNTDAHEAALVAERLRARLATHQIEAGGRRLGVTASFGVAVATLETEDLSDLISAADAAMYQAKSEGRNRVVIVASA